MKRKGLLVGLVLVLLLSVISVACAARPPQPEVIVWKFGTYQAPVTPIAVSEKAIYEELERRSNGRLKIEFNWSGTIADAKQTPDFIGRNVLQSGFVNPGYRAELFPLMRVADLPYLTGKGETLSRAVMDTHNEKDALRKEFENLGLKPLFFVNTPGGGLMPCNEPWRSVDDMKGKKIRIYGTHGAIVEAWGAIPVELPFVDTPQALERGVIDSMTALWFTTYYGMGYHEVVKYALDVGERYAVVGAECMSLDFYNSLPDDVKALVDEMVETWITDLYYETYMKMLMEQVELIAATDLELIRWSPEEMERAKALAVPAASKAYFEEMAERGVEAEAREIYEFLKAKIEEYDPVTTVNPVVDLVAEARK